jgi:hypothetical protein
MPWLAASAAIVCVGCTPSGREPPSAAVAWPVGKWSTSERQTDENREVLIFREDGTYRRLKGPDIQSSQALGRYRIEGDKIILEPQYFSVDAAHGGGKDKKALRIPLPRSRVLNGERATFYKVGDIPEKSN